MRRVVPLCFNRQVTTKLVVTMVVMEMPMQMQEVIMMMLLVIVIESMFIMKTAMTKVMIVVVSLYMCVEWIE